MKRWFLGSSRRWNASAASVAHAAALVEHDVREVPSLGLELPATPAAAPLLRRRVMAFAGDNGATLETQSRIGAAVTEAVANAVTHAYPYEVGVVTCDCDVERGMLEIVIADRGDGFNPGDSPGLGIGLAIIAGCSDNFWIHHGGEQPGVAVWMRFALD
jgi:anti-sigma regulatory factor (Ser/Thr protein kinase)